MVALLSFQPTKIGHTHTDCTVKRRERLSWLQLPAQTGGLYASYVHFLLFLAFFLIKREKGTKGKEKQKDFIK